MTVHHKNKCPENWSRGCYPRHCDYVPPGPPTAPQPAPKPDTAADKGGPPKPVHNVVYLVDEHDVSKVDLTLDINNQVFRNDKKTLIRRWAFHHKRVNLLTMNVPEAPDSIKLPDLIADPKNDIFKWEGFMYGEFHMSLHLLSYSFTQDLVLRHIAIYFRHQGRRGHIASRYRGRCR